MPGTPAKPDGLSRHPGSRLPEVLDHDRFAALLNLAGPAHGRELVEHLVQDLEQVLERLTAGWAVRNWADLGSQSHILIALAGAVGARPLQALAEAVNQHAQHPDPAPLAEVMPALLEQLAALIRYVAGQRPGSDA